MVKSVDSWMLPIKVNGVTALALVDSGASATMISQAVFEKMTPGSYPIIPSAHKVTGVGGQRVGLLGEVHAEIQIAEKLWNMDVSLSERYEPVDCYLGIDFFTEHRCDFSVKTG